MDRPLFRSTQVKTKRLTGNSLTTKDVCRTVKRQLKDAGVPSTTVAALLTRDGDSMPPSVLVKLSRNPLYETAFCGRGQAGIGDLRKGV